MWWIWSFIPRSYRANKWWITEENLEYLGLLDRDIRRTPRSQRTKFTPNSILECAKTASSNEFLPKNSKLSTVFFESRKQKPIRRVSGEDFRNNSLINHRKEQPNKVMHGYLIDVRWCFKNSQSLKETTRSKRIWQVWS